MSTRIISSFVFVTQTNGMHNEMFAEFLATSKKIDGEIIISTLVSITEFPSFNHFSFKEFRKLAKSVKDLFNLFFTKRLSND